MKRGTPPYIEVAVDITQPHVRSNNRSKLRLVCVATAMRNQNPKFVLERSNSKDRMGQRIWLEKDFSGLSEREVGLLLEACLTAGRFNEGNS